MSNFTTSENLSLVLLNLSKVFGNLNHIFYLISCLKIGNYLQRMERRNLELIFVVPQKMEKERISFIIILLSHNIFSLSKFTTKNVPKYEIFLLEKWVFCFIFNTFAVVMIDIFSITSNVCTWHRVCSQSGCKYFYFYLEKTPKLFSDTKQFI